MKKIKFSEHILPHLIASLIFLIVTFLFFSPAFFENKAISQGDIQQFTGASKSTRDFREATGEEALWAPSMFSGMPAYLVGLKWSEAPVSFIKRILTFSLPHPIANIFAAFACYYILLLCFRVRPYLSVAGALAFGLSSYMIIGLMAGHNARIGAIAFMPLVMAGIHLAFSGKRLLGFAATAAGLALQLRENHLQITYYLILIVAVYGLVQLVFAIRARQINEFFKSIAVLIPAALLGAATFAGPFWAVTEYTKYSIRGPSELVKQGVSLKTDQEGLSKEYAFQWNYGIQEPMTLLIPEYYGGSSLKAFVNDQKSATYNALVNSGNNELANKLANYTVTYWGPQTSGTLGPYYAGAVIVFLFVLGILFADKKYVWWLVPVSILSLMISWGDSFESFNYFMFDHFPGYNKFRSFSFALIMILFAMPLLGFIGLEKFLTLGLNKETKKKLILAASIVGGFCLILLLFAGMGSFTRGTDYKLPPWFLKALQSDRKALLRADAFRTLSFIVAIFIVLYFNVRKLSEAGFYAFLIFIVGADLASVDKRYFTKDSYQRKHDLSFVAPTPADEAILKDKDHYRVFNPQWTESLTAYNHYSVGGYHGAKMRRYQDLYDSCLTHDFSQLYSDGQKGKLNFEKYGALNMLNTRYLVLGQDAESVVFNPAANGVAWFAKEVTLVNSPIEELDKINKINTKEVAVVDQSKFKVGPVAFDSTAFIKMTDFNPNVVKYESQSAAKGLGVFSEIYYPKGWHATIDGQEVPIIRADYVLRALEIPAGKHTIEFKFEPKAYVVGNKITSASSWILLLVVFGSIGWSLKEDKK